MTYMNSIGWDIGGAHTKAAVINQTGGILAIIQQPCPLWKGLDQLQHAVQSIIQQLPIENYCHVITMTGELVDLFDNRQEGVRQILSTMKELLPNREILVFAGQKGFLKDREIDVSDYQAIASANWLASAFFVAQKIGNGLFIDIGSTTTDILLLRDNQVRAQGYTDYQRLLSQELIYTGIVRTAVMAIAHTALDEGKEIGLMAEYFATMADVYRLTGELNEAHDQTETADGAEKSITASAKRLSRMIGCDFFPDQMLRWQHFANNIRTQQLQKIQRGCENQLSRYPCTKNNPLIGAGIGRFLVKQLAENLGYPYLDFSRLCSEPENNTGITAADCAPAVSIAYLARGL
jgi:probable H4MPT-linked C1 transfer pathway protein